MNVGTVCYCGHLEPSLADSCGRVEGRRGGNRKAEERKGEEGREEGKDGRERTDEWFPPLLDYSR